jgi:hypothetical protein
MCATAEGAIMNRAPTDDERVTKEFRDSWRVGYCV